MLKQQDSLALLPTGGGKSLCYQVPALINEGVCLVISPLISLMLDQVSRLKQQGVRAACVHSGMRYAEVRQTLENTMHGGYKLLYVSPERLQTELFRDYSSEFEVSMIAVDEAHCVSQWGHDFRPDYLKISGMRETFPNVPLLALTATATHDVQADIIKQLNLRHAAVFKQSFARDNIFYDVRYSENKAGDAQSNAGRQCGIIYCRSRKQTEHVSKYMNQAGITAVAYHAGMSKDRREEAQQLWMSGSAPLMVATTAFGMGIDKGDVRTVLHYDAPEHPEAYYQEAGRAGRDGKQSEAILLYNSTDIKRLHDSIALQYPPEQYLRQVYQAVVEYLQVPISAEPDRYYPFDLHDFCKKFSLQANNALHALKLLEQEGLWTMSEAVYSPATIEFTADRHVLDGLRAAHPALSYVTTGLLRMYNTVFHFPTQVRETAIAKQLKMSKEELIPLLEQLDRMEILRYNKPGEGPQLFFHHYRVSSRDLIINLNRIEVLRKRHEVRTEAMIAFLENRTVCRERMLLNYFGEVVNKDCGHCDVCRNKQNKQPDRKELNTRLIEYMNEAGTTTLEKLLSHFPTGYKEAVIGMVREMLDDHVLTLTGSNLQLSSNTRPDQAT